MNRKLLPYRRNCEGYFFLKGRVLAQKREGYIEFPGGGFDKTENAKKAILRETFEETGAVIKNLHKIGVIYFDWGENWAKTEKQNKRYNQFRGEEMHLFSGEIKELKEAPGDGEELGLLGERLMEIKKLIKILNSMKPFPKNMDKYYSKQLEVMKDYEEN